MGKWLIGVDEAGRGPFAGPVTLALFAAPRRLGARLFAGIRDSKKLSASAREAWFTKFKAEPRVFFCSTSVGPHSIDRWGIAKAIRRGIRRMLMRALKKHASLRGGSCETILLDGSLSAPSEYPQKTIIKGDEKVPVIAAASIIAKVRRDRYMVRLAKKYPQYGFEIHKGYGTKLHRERIRKHGLCDAHRRSFCAKYAN
ncbi:MAG: ribonuclease HII [Candidatus Niyogibacteria bacterium]|nr:ribonuclease HII [Candidatus Niyogibacteria bacterium]